MNAQQLKNAILQEAIEGRLVPQDPNDEPASALLARIRKEKEQLVKAGQVYKKKDTQAFYGEGNWPFQIPANWVWAQLSDISIIQEGAGIRKYQYTKEGTQLLCVTNILDGKVDLSKKKLFVSEKEYKEKYIHLTPQVGDIVTACSGGSWGKVAIYERNDIVMLNTSTLRLRFFGDLADNMYLYYIAQSKFFKDQLADQLVGIQPNFGYAHYSRINIPLPPLEEQKRIVAKIDELLPKVEEYGKAQDALNKLNTELPERLKKSILQEAIEGRLVPQAPNDEPASVLLAKIRKEKEQLVKEGKLKKKDLIETPITDDEIPFEIPESWEWCRLADYLDVRDGTHDSPKYYSEGIPFVTSKNLDNGKIDFATCKYISEEDHKKFSERSYVEDGDILFAMIGSIGNPVIVKKDREFSIKNVALFKRYSVELTNYQYIYYYLLFIQNELKKISSGGVQSFVGLKTFREWIFPLPPLAEQHRIVKKLEQVLGEIEKLKK